MMDSIDLHNESQATLIQEEVPRLIHHEKASEGADGPLVHSKSGEELASNMYRLLSLDEQANRR